MKAIIIDSHGNHEKMVQKEVSIPEHKPDELLVKIYATTVNPIDWKIREGLYVDYFPISFPFILGSDFSGEVIEVGADTSGFKKGDLVYGKSKSTSQGTYAEYFAVHYKEVSPKPNNLDHVQSAAIATVGITAWEALFDKAQLKSKQSIAIIGASGGVGSIAIQLAKNCGSHVTGICSSKNKQLVESIGANKVICYDKEKLSNHYAQFDVVFDTVGADNLEEGWKMVKDSGYHVSCANMPKPELKEKYPTLRSDFVFIKPSPTILSKLTKLIEGNKLIPVIDEIMTLDQIQKAHLYVKNGRTRGKVAIKIV